MQKGVLPAEDSGVAYVRGIQAAVAAKVVRVLSDRELSLLMADIYEPLTRLLGVSAAEQVGTSITGSAREARCRIGGLEGFTTEGAGGKYAVMMLKLVDLDRVWQLVVPFLLQVLLRMCAFVSLCKALFVYARAGTFVFSYLCCQYICFFLGVCVYLCMSVCTDTVLTHEDCEHEDT